MTNRVYLFRGDEKFLTNTKIQKLIRDSKVDEFNITTYDCAETNLEQAIFDVCTAPFLSDRKIVIIKNPTFLESDKTNHNVNLLIQYLDHPLEDSLLIINATGMKVNEKAKATSALLNKATVITTNGISEVEFSGWLQRECETQGKVRIENAAISLFYKTIGINLEEAKNEVDKIITYVGEGGVITEEVAKKLLCKGSQNDIYSLTNAIFDKDKAKVLKLYEELTRYEKDVTVFINLITKSFKDILIVKILDKEGLNQNSIANKMHLNPNRVYYMLKNASNYSLEEIEDNVSKLANLDLKIKSGQIDKKIGFEQYLLGL